MMYLGFNGSELSAPLECIRVLTMTIDLHLHFEQMQLVAQFKELTASICIGQSPTDIDTAGRTGGE